VNLLWPYWKVLDGTKLTLNMLSLTTLVKVKDVISFLRNVAVLILFLKSFVVVRPEDVLLMVGAVDYAKLTITLMDVDTMDLTPFMIAKILMLYKMLVFLILKLSEEAQAVNASLVLLAKRRMQVPPVFASNITVLVPDQILSSKSRSVLIRLSAQKKVKSQYMA